MKKNLVISLLIILFLFGCVPANRPARTTNTVAPTQITVLAAASLTESFTEIGKRFEEANSGVTVVFNFAGTQELFQQIEQGIPADVFASANAKYMNDSVSAGYVDEAGRVIFAKNALTVIHPNANPGELKILADLSKPGLKIVIAAKEVPVGKYTNEFLDNTSQDTTLPENFKENFLANVVSYENNVKGVVSKVVLGEADAGIVYFTDVTGDALTELGMIEIPSDLNVIASYPIATLKSSQNVAFAQAFVDYVLSDVGQGILKNYGFINP
ncbi:MAG: molybdate ABC transporter substrate-binding protein [Chloroflexi bacterium HGW-Chloroflexi-8]|nr:MAG: molybdate ABC transporter substrate-binding protein [Chloroflexi bacterium HGW-Chloroflexi-8]